MVERYINIEYAKTLEYSEFYELYKGVCAKYSIDCKKYYGQIRATNKIIEGVQLEQGNRKDNKGKSKRNIKSDTKRTDL